MKLNKTKQKLYLDGEVGIINDGTVEQLREVTNDRDYMGRFTYYHKNRIFPSDAPLDNVQYHQIAWFYENETELPKRVRVDKANEGWYDTEIGNVFNVISEDDGKYFVEHPLNTEYLKHFIHKSDCTPIYILQSGNVATEYDVVCKQDPYYRLSCGVVKQDDCTPINETNNELPKVGEWWECVENVSIDGSKIFTSGKKYKCEDEGYLTNNNKKRTLIAGCNDYRSHFIKSTQPTPTSYKLNIDIPEWVLKSGNEIEVGRLPRSIMEYIATKCITFTLENGTQIELTNNDIDKIKKL